MRGQVQRINLIIQQLLNDHYTLAEINAELVKYNMQIELVTDEYKDACLTVNPVIIPNNDEFLTL